jgi:hypothetical protein
VVSHPQELERRHDDRFRWTGRLFFGLVVIALGILFTLDNLDLIESGDILRWWPALLIVVGFAKILGVGTLPRPVFGGFVALLGTWWLLNNLDIIDLEPWDLWPVFLIGIGIAIVIRATRTSIPAVAGGDPDTRMSAFALWSGSTRRITSQEFQGGDVTAIMGGHEIDLRESRPAGGTCVIDLFVWWGGVDITVPDDWRVSVEGLALMGAIEDSTRGSGGEVRGHLILKGLVVMGGVEVKNKK